MNLLAQAALAALLLAPFAACNGGSDESEPDPVATLWEMSAPSYCARSATGICTPATECGIDYAGCYDTAQSACCDAIGGCVATNVIYMDDETLEGFNACLDDLNYRSCDELASGHVPSSCDGF